MLPGQRPYRELYWLSLMPGADITAVGAERPAEAVAFARRPYLQLSRRFVEAGALALMRGLRTSPGDFDWIASLELCSLITGQGTGLARRTATRQAVLTWGNDARNLLYRLPPYWGAVRRARGADLFLCLIQAAKAHCVELGIPEERCAVVHPGIDTAVFRPPPRPVEEPALVFASPLAPNKGIDRVIEAFGMVRGRVPDATLTVVGGGPLEGFVRAHAEASAGAIQFLGRLDRGHVAEVLRRSAVFVTAPRPTRVWNEQFGLAYLEAMASGVVVVTTMCGTNHEAVPPPNVRVPDDAGLLAEAVVGFLADPSARARAGERNRAHVLEHHEVQRQSRLMGDAFRAAMEREPVARRPG